MKLAKLLELHFKFSPKGILPDNFGDSFLIETNRIFRKIREMALKEGYIFSNEVDSDYLALGLSQLENILTAKKIPYYNNVSVLEMVEKKISQSTIWDEVADNLKRNFVFHESCHVIARSASLQVLKDETSQNEKVLRLLLEESFSNTCELLGIIDVQDSAQRIFYEINSYIFVYEARTHLSAVAKDLGFQNLMKVFILAYLHSNFLLDSLNEKQFERILKTTFNEKKIDTKISKNLKALTRICFELNPRFRMVTTGFFMRLQGVKGQPQELVDFDFMDMIEKNPQYDQFLNALVASFNF